MQYSNRSWQQKLQDAANASSPAVRAIVDTTAAITQGPAFAAQAAKELREAAGRYDQRRDGFAEGKGATCRDIAAKLDRFGSFASPKQQDFAMKLIGWSLPRTGAPAAPVVAAVTLPNLFKVMQKHAKFYAGDLELSRRNADTLVWIKWQGRVVGVLENAVRKLHERKLTAEALAAVAALLAEFEQDPLAAAMKYGKLSGRCCSCGADLTNDESIELGIGPICRQKF